MRFLGIRVRRTRWPALDLAALHHLAGDRVRVHPVRAGLDLLADPPHELVALRRIGVRNVHGSRRQVDAVLARCGRFGLLATVGLARVLRLEAREAEGADRPGSINTHAGHSSW